MNTYDDLKQCAARVRARGYVPNAMFTPDGTHGCVLGVMSLVAGYTPAAMPGFSKMGPRFNSMFKAVVAEIGTSRSALLLDTATFDEADSVARWNDREARQYPDRKEVVAKMFDYAAARIKGATQAATADTDYVTFRTNLQQALAGKPPTFTYFDYNNTYSPKTILVPELVS